MTRSEDLVKETNRVRQEVCEAIKSAMREQRVSLYQLAKDSELNYSSVIAVYKGNANSKFETIIKICTSLGIKIMVI